ncbi:MAG: hypothetical protein IH948_06895 [Bacteroidetes bacterium]|nr:hypothetical protein [Bacteroidota bacterium]
MRSAGGSEAALTISDAKGAQIMLEGSSIKGYAFGDSAFETYDLIDEFASALTLLDEMFLLDIYPARELPIEGISSQALADKVLIKEKKVVSRDNLLEEIKKGDFEVVMTIGAGDIAELVDPIKFELLSKMKN